MHRTTKIAQDRRARGHRRSSRPPPPRTPASPSTPPARASSARATSRPRSATNNAALQKAVDAKSLVFTA